MKIILKSISPFNMASALKATETFPINFQIVPQPLFKKKIFEII